MLQPREFLSEECDNVERSLNECLQHNYGAKRSKQFFHECQSRLRTIREQIGKDSVDLPSLKQHAFDISRLSSLIARIERSRLGEFSWPFADELEKIASATCQGISGEDKHYRNPIFAISAGGGLDAYRIHIEQDPVDFFNQRIFNIVFPRSLKQHVLFHPILAHEVGHASLTAPSMESELMKRVFVFLETGPFEDTAVFSEWFTQSGLGDISGSSDDELDDMLDSWVEECFCDLFGLLVFGPSFLGAHQSLICGLDPTGLDPGDEHPPNVVRYHLLRTAVEVLGWSKHPEQSGFWRAVSNFPHSVPKWAEVHTEESVSNALSELQDVLQPLTVALYRTPADGELHELTNMLRKGVPPIGANINSKGVVNLNKVDFRTILFAGWLTWFNGTNKKLTFFQLNQLCGHAILQQQAVRLWMDRRS